MDDDLVGACLEAGQLHGERGVAAFVRVQERAVEGDFGGLADLLELDDVVLREVGFLQVEFVAVEGVAAFERDHSGAVRGVHGVRQRDLDVFRVSRAFEIERFDLLHGGRDGLDPGRGGGIGGGLGGVADAALRHDSGEQCGCSEEGEGGQPAAVDA